MEKEVARGAFGAVHLAQWRSTTVAVKVLLRGATTPKQIDAYLKELDLTSQLRHPRVVALLGACMTLPNLCIVLEYASRGGLDGVLYPKRSDNSAAGGLHLTPGLRLRMALSVARGLAYLHASDPPFIHRDLKPANCFVFEDPAIVKVGCVGSAFPALSVSFFSHTCLRTNSPPSSPGTLA